MGKDTEILDELQFKLVNIQSDIEELTEIIDQIETSEDLKSGLSLMSANMISEASDMMDLLDGYLEEEDFENDEGDSD